MKDKEFLKIETEASTDENGNINGWQELADQAPEYWSEMAMKKLTPEELYPQNKELYPQNKDGEESNQEYEKRLADINALTSDEYDEYPSEIEEQYPDGYPYGKIVYERGNSESGYDYTYGNDSEAEHGYKFVEHAPDVSSEFEKHLNINALRTAEVKRRRRDYNNRYSKDHKRDVDRQREVIEESNARKTEEQLLRDEISKDFELFFSQLPKLGFFNLDGQPPAEIIYPSEYDDDKRGIDDAAKIPIIVSDKNGGQKISRQLITFDLTTGRLKEDRLKELIHGSGCGLTDFQYPSDESGNRLSPANGVPNFIIYLPLPQIHDDNPREQKAQRKARYEKILEGISETGYPPEKYPDKSGLEEFFDSMRRGELPSQEIQDLINFQIATQAAIFSKRYEYDEKRLSEINQNDAVSKKLEYATEKKKFFDDMRKYFGGRISSEARKDDMRSLVARNDDIYKFLSEIAKFIKASEDTLTANSYSASPDN